MKLMVSVFFVKGRFCSGRKKKTQHFFFGYGLHFIQQEALKPFFPNKCCFEFGVGILCVLGMWFQELRDAYCMMVDLLF